MARKASESSSSSRGFDVVICVALLAAVLLLLVAQLSFDPYDVSVIRNPPNRPAHNWIGPLGAQMAFCTFFVRGFSAYMLPIVLIAFGLAFWFEPLAYLRRRWPWALLLLVSCMGWLYLLDHPHLSDPSSAFSRARHAIGSPSIGGFIGRTLYEDGFWMLGSVGSGIVYGALDLISLLFLTNFQLGEWVRGFWGRLRAPGERAEKPSPQEE